MTSIKYDYNFLAGVFIDGEIELNSYNLNIHLYIETYFEENHQIAFARMDYLLNNFVDNAIFIEKSEITAIENYTNNGFNCITFDNPGPIDQIVQVTLVNKLNAITNNVLYIFESELSSLRGGYVKYMYLHSEEIANIEYKLISSDSKEWWNDPHPNTISVNSTDDILNFKHHTTWENLNLNWITTDDPKKDDDITTTPNIITMNSPVR